MLMLNFNIFIGLVEHSAYVQESYYINYATFQLSYWKIVMYTSGVNLKIEGWFVSYEFVKLKNQQQKEVDQEPKPIVSIFGRNKRKTKALKALTLQ
jgi:hypothetical protein